MRPDGNAQRIFYQPTSRALSILRENGDPGRLGIH
jgi:hypothetical protein